MRAGRAAFLNRILYRRRLRKDSITSAEKCFDHVLGILSGWKDIMELYRQLEESLSADQRDAAWRVLRADAADARRLYMGMPESCRGEEYGLAEDYSLFRLLDGDWCAQAELRKRDQAALKKTREELREAREALREKTAEANTLAARLEKYETKDTRLS